MQNSRLIRGLLILFGILALIACLVDIEGLKDRDFGRFVMKDSALLPLYNAIGMGGVLALKVAVGLGLIGWAILLAVKSRRRTTRGTV